MSWGEISCEHFAKDCPIEDANILTCNKDCREYVTDPELLSDNGNPYKPGDIIDRCHGCGCAIFYSDEDLNLMDWVADADYETTGHRTPYCRECYHEAITRSE